MQNDNAKSNASVLFKQSTTEPVEVNQFEEYTPLMASHQLNTVTKLLSSELQDNLMQLAIVKLAMKMDAYASKWEKTANLTQELQEILSTYSDINNYLYAGQLYLIQSRHKHALQVLTDGLDHFHFGTPEHVLTEKLKQLALQHLRTHVDIMIQSPYEVFSYIISYLDPESKNICTYVSRTWRSRILDCAEAWRVLDLAGSRSHKRTKSLELLPAVAQHIETLYLRNDPQVNIQCIRLLSTEIFFSLQSLTISNYTSVDLNLESALYGALPVVAQTLSELRIIIPLSLDINIGVVLAICRGLTRIECRVSSIADSRGCVDIHHQTLLTSVDLESTKYFINVPSLQPLLKYSPHLESLILSRCEGDILSVIGNGCPKLKTIISNSNKYKAMNSTVPLRLADTATTGLQCLSLDPVYSMQPIQSRLKASCDSLRTMYIAPRSDNIHGEFALDWEPLSSFTMCKLTHLSIDGSGSTAAFRTCLPAMLRCCPNIETLLLQSCFDQEEPPGTTVVGADSIFNAMMDMENLTCLDMIYVRTGGQSLVRLLQFHGIHGSRLQKLSIVGGENLAGDIIQHAAKIKSLRELTIQNMRGLTTSNVTEFARLISQLDHLSTLTLAGMKLKIGAARDIAACKCLYSLTAYNLVITEEASLVLRNNIQNVKMF